MKPGPRLLATVRELLRDPDLEAVGDAGQPEDDVAETPEEVSGMAELFAGLCGAPCPPGLRAGLLLPDRVTVRWTRGPIAGELAVGNPVDSLSRRLDDSLLGWTMDGVPLSETRIADAVTDLAGPLHVLFRAKPDEVLPTLWLFDTRELLRLDLDFEAYLTMAAASRGIVFWQLLFCDGRLTPDKARHLAAGLRLLRDRYDDPELAELEARLKERTDLASST